MGAGAWGEGGVGGGAAPYSNLVEPLVDCCVYAPQGAAVFLLLVHGNRVQFILFHLLFFMCPALIHLTWCRLGLGGLGMRALGLEGLLMDLGFDGLLRGLRREGF